MTNLDKISQNFLKIQWEITAQLLEVSTLDIIQFVCIQNYGNRIFFSQDVCNQFFIIMLFKPHCIVNVSMQLYCR